MTSQWTILPVHPQATTSLARGIERVDYWPLHSGV